MSFSSALASLRLKVAGLSLSTWKPFSIAILAGGKCMWLGVTMDTKSIRSSAGNAASLSIISSNVP